MSLASRKVVGFSLLVIGLCSMLLARQSHFFTETDFFAWGQDALRLADCIKGSACELSKFPLGYMLNSSLVEVSTLYISQQVPTILLGINILFAFIFFVALWSLSICRDLRVFLVFISAIMLTPIPSFYIYSAALEFQSGLILTLWALLFSNKEKVQSVLLITLTMVTCFYKDTNGVLLVVFIVAATLENLALLRCSLLVKLDEPIEMKVFGQKLRACAIGLIIGQLAMFTYNYIRYSDILPRQYIHEAIHRSPGTDIRISNLLSLLFSPHGGLLSFWGLSCVFLLLALNHSYKRFYASVLMVTVFTLVGLSGWWAPFGWNAWGSRLTIPMMILVVGFTCFSSKNKVLLAPSNGGIMDPRHVSKEFNTLLIFFRVLAISCILAISLPYIAKSYSPGSTEKRYYDYLYGTKICKDMDAKESSSTIGDLFWLSEDYHDCSKVRFWGE